jgi:hypothetical protein
LAADAEPGALRGGALDLARSWAFLARWVAKVCAFAALSDGPVSQAASLVVVVGGGGDGAGTAAATVAVAVVGLEAMVDFGIGME